MPSRHQSSNPIPLFISIALSIITAVTGYFHGLSVPLLCLVILGVSFYWISTWLTTRDRYTHSDCIQNGTALVPAFTLFSLHRAGCTSVYLYVLIPYVTLVIFELFNNHVIKSRRDEFPLWGTLVQAALAAIIVFMVIPDTQSYIPPLTRFLNGWGKIPYTEPLPLFLLMLLLVCILLISFLFRKSFALYAHGPFYYNGAIPAETITGILIIILKSVALTMAVLILGVHMGLALYIMQTSNHTAHRFFTRFC